MKNLKISLKVFFKTISPPLKIAVVGVFLVIFTFMACQKDSIDNLNKTTENSVSIQEFRANIDPLEKLVLNPDDKAAEFINKSNVEIAKVLIDLVTREDINRFIVETAKANEGNVYYEQVFKQFPDIKPLFKNTVIGKRGISKSFTTSDGETYDFVRNDIAYKSMIFVANESIAQPSDRSILSPEIQIYRETGEGDIYFAWDVKKDKPKKEINIIEREAMATTTPVIMTSLQHVAFLKPVKLINNSTTPKFIFDRDTNKAKLQTRGQWDDFVYVRKANLLFNYDGGTSSELYVAGGWIDNNGTSGLARSDKSVFYVSSVAYTCSLLGTNKDNLFTTYFINFWQTKKYFFNSYEYDWGSSNKPLGTVNANSGVLNFAGHRQFTDEWYTFNPQVIQDYTYAVPMSYMFANPGSGVSPMPDNNPNGTTNDCAPGNGFLHKAEIQFTRGWY